MPRTRGRTRGRGLKLGAKSPRIWTAWGPVTITKADGTVEVRPPLKPKRWRK